MRVLAWFGMAATLLLAVEAHGAAPASSPAEARQACAAAARFPTLRDRTGTPFTQLDPATAIPACRHAVELSPRDHASRANLGRALLKAKAYDEAFVVLLAAAKAGDPQAQHNLARSYENGQGVAKDHLEQVRWLQRAAAQGYAASQNALGVAYESGDGVKQDYRKAIAWYRKAGANGEPLAWNNVGSLYEDGNGVPKDMAEAMRQYRRAGEAGEPLGLRNLGRLYWHGLGVAANKAEGVRHWRLAAERNDATAQAWLAMAYRDGEGVARDYAEARRWFRRAADLGDDDGLVALASLMERGLGGPVDRLGALALLRQGAEAGLPGAQYRLGWEYGVGGLVARDDAMAAKYYRAAADQEHVRARFALGVAYAKGEGVAKDTQEALKLYSLAAEAGDVDARYNLANYYKDGTAGPREPLKALSLYRQAAAQGDRGARMWLTSFYYAGRRRADTALDPTRSDKDIYHRADSWSPAQVDYTLGKMYLTGVGVAADPVQAALLLRRAAVAGHAEARHALAGALALGVGGPADIPAALDLIEAGAASGHLESTVDLAYPAPWFASGAGRPIESARWRADLDGRTGAEDRARIAFALVNDKLVAQDFGGALRRLSVGDGRSEIDLRSARISLLIDMRLYSAATADFLHFAGSEAFKALPDAMRTIFIRRFNDDIESACAWEAIERASIEQLERLHALGVDGAAYQLGQNYANGRGVPEDEDRAIHWLQIAADKGYGRSRFALAWQLSNAKAPDYVAARRYYQLASDEGVATATLNLGLLLEHGLGGESDPVRAASLYRAAESGGQTRASRYLAALHERGSGVEANAADAMSALERAAEWDDEEAQAEMGRMIESAPGADTAEAVRWYRLAARNGSARGRASLALAYKYGRGVARDPAMALRILREGADKGEAESRRELGTLYWEGLAVTADPAEAVRLWRLATDAHDRPAAIRLARAHVLGRGASRDIAAVRAVLLQGSTRKGALAAEPRAAVWLTACANAARIECFAQAPGFFDDPDAAPAAPSAAVALPEASLEAQAAPLLQQFEATQVDGAAGTYKAYEAVRKLELLYALHERGDLVVQTRLRWTVVQEAQLEREYGGINNYFALITSACHWGQASKVSHANGRPEAALLFAKMAVNRLQQARTYIGDLDDDIRECFIEAHKDRYRWLADLFIEMGRFPEAENVLGMLKHFELHTYTRDGDSLGASRAELPLGRREVASQGQAAEAITSLAFASATTERLRRGSGELTPAQTALKASAENALATAKTEFRRQLAELQASVAQLDETASLSVADVRALPTMSTTIREVFARNGEKVAALHAVVLPDRVQWLLSTAGYQKAITISISKADLNKLIGDLRLALRDPEADSIAPSRKFFDRVFKSVEAELQAAGVTQVMLSLDGGLRYIPFAALHDGQGWLVRKYAFSVFRQSSSHILTLPPAEEFTIAGFGASKGGAGMSPLPDVAFELRGIVHDGRRLYLDERFTRRQLTDTLKEDATIIHVATHFNLNPDKLDDSALLLGDGNLLRLADFQANGEFSFERVQLLTLSACETALEGASAGGEKAGGMTGLSGAEVDGMAGVAQNAGARAVMASLWSVADESTAVLMQDFYSRWKPGTAKSEALRRAQLEMIAGRDGRRDPHQRARGAASGHAKAQPVDLGPAHPFFWAPFIVVGNWR